jgi:hypothetical protein
MGARKQIRETSGNKIPAVGLFSTPEGVRTVQSPVRKKILALLARGEHSFDEIVQESGKAKSTVSVHLRQLVRDGILGEKTHATDSRKKTFFLQSACLGTFAGRLPKDSADAGFSVPDMLSGEDPFRFYRLMFRTIRVSLLREGINIDPVLEDAGFRVGLAIYPSVAVPGLGATLDNLARFWAEHNLGILEIESLEPVTLRNYDCFECGDLPQLGRPACAFDAGILRAVFSRYFGTHLKVNETACYAMGDDHCRFVITPK